jgi:hypothetical protein
MIMDMEDATNPIGGDDTALATVAGAPEVDAESREIEIDDQGNPIAEPEDDDSEEVDFDGEKYKVPKALKDAFLRQADYTRKTQEVAEARKAFEAERQTFHQAGAAELQARAQLVAIDQQIAHFQRIDWDTWEQQDPFEAQKGWRQFQQLQNGRGQAAGQIAQLAQHRQVQTQQETARRLDEGRTVLARDIKGWSPQLAETLLDHGVRQYGFKRGEIEEFSDPRMVKVLHDAFQYRQLDRKNQQARSHADAQQAQPAAKVTRASAPASGLDDRLTIDEWTRRRNEQVRKRAR